MTKFIEEIIIENKDYRNPYSDPEDVNLTTAVGPKKCKRLFFSNLGFLSRTFTNDRTAGEGGGHFFNSALPLPPTSQALRHSPRDYWRELTSAHR